MVSGILADKLVTGHIHLQNYSVYNHDTNENETLTFSSLRNHLFEVKLDQITDATFLSKPTLLQ